MEAGQVFATQEQLPVDHKSRDAEDADRLGGTRYPVDLALPVAVEPEGGGVRIGAGALNAPPASSPVRTTTRVSASSSRRGSISFSASL
jgi:hypothetical protein